MYVVATHTAGNLPAPLGVRVLQLVGCNHSQTPQNTPQVGCDQLYSIPPSTPDNAYHNRSHNPCDINVLRIDNNVETAHNASYLYQECERLINEPGPWGWGEREATPGPITGFGGPLHTQGVFSTCNRLQAFYIDSPKPCRHHDPRMPNDPKGRVNGVNSHLLKAVPITAPHSQSAGNIRGTETRQRAR